MLLFKYLGENFKSWKAISAIIISALAWLLLWYFPWQDKLHHIYWLQLGIGLLIFILPGFCIYGILSEYPSVGFSQITFGFAISNLLFAVLGAIGRLTHLSFEFILFLMMAFGLIFLILYVPRLINQGIKSHRKQYKFEYLLVLLSIMMIFVLVGLIVIQRTLSDDDLTYLAYQNIFQHAVSLDFNFPVLDESHLASPRFWLMSVPLTQAFLAAISKMPGILTLGGYYEPFLVLLSVLSWYELATTLKLPPRAANASVILQLIFLLLLSEYLHPGSPYFNQLSTDKATAAFVLAPIFFQSLIKFLEYRTRNNMFLFLFTGLSLTFMHPIILAYAVFIGSIILLSTNKKSFRKNLIPVIIFIIILSPQIAIRFVTVPDAGPASFDSEVILNQSGSDQLITQWGNNLYGFNLDILSIKLPYEENIPLPEPIIKWGWLLIPALAFFLAIQQDNILARFIVASFLLCFLAGLPLTGWIIGYFLNGRMLARSVWLFPYGLSSVYLFMALRDRIKGTTIMRKYKISNISVSSNWLLFTLMVMTFALFSLYIHEKNFLDLEKFLNKSQRYQGLATAGQELDRRISDSAFVVGSPQLNDLIPGVSAKSKIITFRIAQKSNMPYFSDAQREERISDTQRLFAKSPSPADKMLLIEKYDIRFLFLQNFDLRLFEDFIESYPDRITITDAGGVILLEIIH